MPDQAVRPTTDYDQNQKLVTFTADHADLSRIRTLVRSSGLSPGSELA